MTAFTVVFAALVIWIFVYHVGGEALLGKSYEELNISNVDLDSLLQSA